jgi:hypothetical protein
MVWAKSSLHPLFKTLAVSFGLACTCVIMAPLDMDRMAKEREHKPVAGQCTPAGRTTGLCALLVTEKHAQEEQHE